MKRLSEAKPLKGWSSSPQGPSVKSLRTTVLASPWNGSLLCMFILKTKRDFIEPHGLLNIGALCGVGSGI